MDSYSCNDSIGFNVSVKKNANWLIKDIIKNKFFNNVL